LVRKKTFRNERVIKKSSLGKKANQLKKGEKGKKEN